MKLDTGNSERIWDYGTGNSERIWDYDTAHSDRIWDHNTANSERIWEYDAVNIKRTWHYDAVNIKRTWHYVLMFSSIKRTWTPTIYIINYVFWHARHTNIQYKVNMNFALFSEPCEYWHVKIESIQLLFCNRVYHSSLSRIYCHLISVIV